MERNTTDLSSVFERLSSGQRINRASDDAAGLAVSSSLNAKSRIYSKGIRNVNDGLSMLEGSLGSLRDIVTRVSELSEQAASGSYSAKQRVELDREADSLLKEYNRIIQSTSFNGTNILDGSQATVYLQHGMGTDQMTGINLASEIGERAGDGTFALGVGITSQNGPLAITLADLNNDGALDSIHSNYSSQTVTIALGNGDGTFRAGTHTAAFGRSEGLLGIDINNDGNVDVVSADFGGKSVRVALGQGNGTLSAVTSFSTSGETIGVTAGDFNGDGIIDLATAEISEQRVSIFIGNGNGTFKQSSIYSVSSIPRAITKGDYNNDGYEDIVTVGQDDKASILIGNGNGTFKARMSFNAGTNPRDMATADFNNDGILDVVSANNFGNNLGVLIGNGNGTFRATNYFSTVASPHTVAISDVNSDGVLDLLTGDLGGTTLSILIGNGDGSFKAQTSMVTGNIGSDVAAGDLNGDGVVDLVSTSMNSNSVNVLLGNADASGRRNNLVAMVDLKTIQGARSALDWSKEQINNIAREMGNIGSYQSRLASVSAVLSVTRLNSLAASSRITDTDVASDTADLVRGQILQRTGQAVLAQANQSPQLALTLLRNA